MRHRKRHLFVSFIIAASAHALVGITAGTIVYMKYYEYEPVYEIAFSSIDVSEVSEEQEAKPVVKPPDPVQLPPDPEPVKLPAPKPVKTPELVIPKIKVAEPVPLPEPVRQETISRNVSPPAPITIADNTAGQTEQKISSDKSSIDPIEIGKSIIRPKYPVGARRRGEEGSVTISIKVSSEGRADSITVVESSGFKALDASAVSAAKNAHYVNPSSGEMMQGEATVTIRFKLLE